MVKYCRYIVFKVFTLYTTLCFLQIITIMVSHEINNGDAVIVHPDPATANSRTNNRRGSSMQRQASTKEFLTQLKVDSKIFRRLSSVEDHRATTFDKSGMSCSRPHYHNCSWLV